MTRMIKTIAVAIGLLSLSGVIGQAVPAYADPPSHARSNWKGKDKQTKSVFARWHDQGNDHRDDHRDNRRDHRDDRRNNDDNNRSRNDWRRDSDRNSGRDRNRDSDRDGIRDAFDRYPTDRHRH